MSWKKKRQPHHVLSRDHAFHAVNEEKPNLLTAASAALERVI